MHGFSLFAARLRLAGEHIKEMARFATTCASKPGHLVMLEHFNFEKV